MTDQTSETTPDGLDVAAVEATWLQQCGPCDGGLPMACVCSDADPRPVIASLLAALDEARAEVERLREQVSTARQSARHWHAGFEEWHAEASRLDAALLTAVTDCDGYARLVEQQGWMERAVAAESARDAAEGVVREVRALARFRVSATTVGVLNSLPAHLPAPTCEVVRWDQVRAVLDRLAPVTTDATEGEA